VSREAGHFYCSGQLLWHYGAVVFRALILALGASFLAGQALPPVKDWDSVRITLTRGSCFGGCPAYEVEIRGSGLVVYYGISIDGGVKTTVVDHAWSGTTPAVITALEAAIDRAAHTAKWVAGNSETVPALLLEKYKFTAQSDDSIIAWALTERDPTSFRKLREAAADNPVLAKRIRDITGNPLQ
jgi:hypothetical protein